MDLCSLSMGRAQKVPKVISSDIINSNCRAFQAEEAAKWKTFIPDLVHTWVANKLKKNAPWAEVLFKLHYSVFHTFLWFFFGEAYSKANKNSPWCCTPMKYSCGTKQVCQCGEELGDAQRTGSFKGTTRYLRTMSTPSNLPRNPGLFTTAPRLYHRSPPPKTCPDPPPHSVSGTAVAWR